MKKTKVFIMGTRGFPYLQGGVENHCEEIYPYIQNKGFDVTLLARKRFFKPVNRLKCWENIDVKYFWSPKSQYFESFIHSMNCSIFIIFHRPNLVHIHNIGPGFFIPFLKLFGIKIILTYHSRNYQHTKWNGLARRFLIVCEMISVKYADKIIVVSPTSQDYLQKKYDREATLIQNGIKNIPPVISSGIITELGLIKKKYILFVGRLTPEKSLDVLIPAFLSIEKKVNNGNVEEWKLVIAGKSDNNEAYYNYLKSISNNSKDIIFTGFLDKPHLHSLYKHAGLFILPSNNEGCSLSLLEGISHQLPCLVSDIQENKQFTYSGLSYFQAGNPLDLSIKLSEFIFNPPFLPYAPLTYEKILNWENIANLTANEYIELLKLEVGTTTIDKHKRRIKVKIPAFFSNRLN